MTWRREKLLACEPRINGWREQSCTKEKEIKYIYVGSQEFLSLYSFAYLFSSDDHHYDHHGHHLSLSFSCNTACISFSRNTITTWLSWRWRGFFIPSSSLRLHLLSLNFITKLSLRNQKSWLERFIFTSLGCIELKSQIMLKIFTRYLYQEIWT